MSLVIPIYHIDKEYQHTAPNSLARLLIHKEFRHNSPAGTPTSFDFVLIASNPTGPLNQGWIPLNPGRIPLQPSSRYLLLHLF